MKLESQVVSLNLARRLKELNVKQESLFFYAGVTNIIQAYWEIDREKNYSAFTVAELGEMLPSTIGPTSASLNEKVLVMSKDVLIYTIGYLGNNNYCSPQFQDITEADARAEMLIYLIENNLWKPK